MVPLHYVTPGLTAPQLGAIVWANRRLMVLLLLLGLAITALVMTYWPRTYTASATLMVNYEVNDPLNGKELPIGQLESYLATQIELLQTPELLQAVTERLNLTSNDDYTSGYSSDAGTLHEWVARKVGADLAVFQGQMGSQLIYVTYKGHNAVLAAQIVNTIVDVYKEQDRLRSTGPPAERAKRFAVQLNDLKARVEHARHDLADFRQKNGMIDEQTSATVNAALLANLQGHLLEAQSARHGASVRRTGDQSASDQVLSSVEVQNLKSQLAAQQLRLAQLERVFQPAHPEVQSAREQVAITQKTLDAAIAHYSANARSGLDGAERLEQNLEQAVGRQRAQMQANDQLRGESERYVLELESAQAVYKRALDGYDQIVFGVASLYSNVSVVSQATPPQKATSPRMLTDIAIGCVLSVLAALAIPFSVELAHRRVRCRDDLERHHGIPVLMEFDKLPTRNRTWT